MITTKQLDEWEALANACIEGPLRIHHSHEEGILIYAKRGPKQGDRKYMAQMLDGFLTSEAKLFCASREAVPALIAEVRRMLPVVEAAVVYHEEWAGTPLTTAKYVKAENALLDAVATFKEATE